MGVSSRVTKNMTNQKLILISINAMSKVSQKHTRKKKTSDPILRTCVSKESGGHRHKQAEINL